MALAGYSYPVSFEDIPPLSTVYPKLTKETLNDPFDPYPVSEHPPALDDICLYMHSSGEYILGINIYLFHVYSRVNLVPQSGSSIASHHIAMAKLP